MKCINMGLNTQPPKSEKEREEMYARFIKNNGEVPQWRIDMENEAEALKQRIIEVVETEGECALNWGCTGETLFNCLSCQWADTLPQYRFEIGRYECHVFKA